MRGTPLPKGVTYPKGKINAKLAEGTHKGHRRILERNVQLAEDGLRVLRPFMDLFSDVRFVGTSAP